MRKTTFTKLERILARSFDHKMGETDESIPKIPILTLKEAKISLMIRLGWIAIQIFVFGILIINVIHHW